MINGNLVAGAFDIVFDFFERSGDVKESATEYPDSNQNGVPDAFENRRPITEILNTEFECESNQTVIVELELIARPPKKGEWFIIAGTVRQAVIDYGGTNPVPMICIRRLLSGQLPAQNLSVRKLVSEFPSIPQKVQEVERLKGSIMEDIRRLHQRKDDAR